MNLRTLLIGLSILLSFSAAAADWPQYRADAARSGYTDETLPSKLALRWTYKPAHPPMPAWQGDDTRMPFDHAHHVAVAGELLYFGTSGDGKVYALDAKTGEERWTFYTGGAVRFAPAVFGTRLFAVSDDGFLYCLDTATGSLLWKTPGCPEVDYVLGNDRMISRWPARGGVAVLDDTVYWGAGIWPSEKIYLYATDATTGELRWLNDRSGGLTLDQPHSTASADSGISVQGYLAASDDFLLVPTGRGVPAAFDRADGTFRHLLLQQHTRLGGYETLAFGKHHIGGGTLFDTATGKKGGSLSSHACAVSPELLVWASRASLKALPAASPTVEKDSVDRKGKPVTLTTLAPLAWSFDLDSPAGGALILARDTVFHGTGTNEVIAVDLAKQAETWRAQVDGEVLGLAAASGFLYVSTDTGAIHAFGEERGARGIVHTAARVENPYGENEAAAEAAESILAKAELTKGFCLDLGCGDGALTYELAMRSDLYLCAVDSDAEQLAVAREKLDAAGLYGPRVALIHAELSDTKLPKYFADLVVANPNLMGQDLPEDEIMRLLRPCGGVALVGKAKRIRGPVKDAGAWTHQYADPANTSNSQDAIVRGPLKVLWYRDTDFEMPSRHGRAPSPLFHNGRLFVEGMHGIRALNAYNGRTLWEYPIPNILKQLDQDHLVGTAATGSNYCFAGDTLFVAVESECILLDPATGQERRRFTTPAGAGGTHGKWGFIACDAGMLFGSVANTDHIVKWTFRESDMNRIFSESGLFFALDARTGEVQWTYTPRASIRHNAVAIGGGRVYLIDRPLDAGDRIDAEEAVAARRGETTEEPAPPVLLALDTATGEERWRREEKIHGTLLALSAEHDVLLMTSQFTRFRLPSEAGGEMTGLRASDGAPLWNAPSDPQGHSSRPLLIGSTVYNEPGAWDLRTGERLDFHLERSYGCGIMAGCDNMMLYRSATLGYVDLQNNTGTVNYGGIRPGCWINALPVGGLVLFPDATARCTCSYLMKASMALQPAE